VIPCGEHPDKKNLASFADRMLMCKAAFSRLKHVKILDIENILPKPSFTHQTIETIHSCRPEATLFLIVGEDCANDIARWDGGDKVMELTKIMTVPRSGYDNEGYSLPIISSTEIRDRLHRGEDVIRHTDLGVQIFLSSTGLYSE
jgi:nicotinate-nucleotide adenylyltransferase